MTFPNGNDFGGYNQQPQYNQYPAYSQPQRSRGGNGHSWGDYTSYYAATGRTLVALAKNVYDTFMNNWVAGGGTNVTVSVYSPTTGSTYTMYCSGNSSRVSCSGGDRAKVVIY